LREWCFFSIGEVVGTQKKVLMNFDEDFLSEVDSAFPRLGFNDRASFIRDAVFQEMKRQGVEVSPSLKAAPSRAGKGGKPTHKKKAAKKAAKVYDFTAKKTDLVAEEVSYSLPYLGSVAAGEAVDIVAEDEDEVRVWRRFPKGHFVVRVTGESMLPELEDGDLIVVDSRDCFTPAHGRLCVVSEGRGSVVKRWDRKRGVFESLNREFADLEPSEETVFQGYFVEKVES